MEEKVLKTLRQFHMVEEKDKVLVGLSGGADSVCLLLVLKKLAGAFKLTIEAVHVHHGIRKEEAKRDCDFSEALCKGLNVPFHKRRVDVPAFARDHHLSEEEAGRILRYRVFEELAKKTGADKIAVAHHRDDNAETVLWNLCRGSGLAGLSGISPVRGRIIRPLLLATRKEIEEYLASERVSFCEDSTNNTLDYTRNKIRHRVLPMLVREINAQSVPHIAEAAEEVREAEAYLSEQARTCFRRCGRAGEGKITLDTSILREQPPILQRRVLRMACEQCHGSLKDLTRRHTEALAELIWGDTGKRLSLPGGLCAVREYERLIFCHGTDSAEENEQKWKEEEFAFTVFPYEKGQKIPENRYTKWFDYDKITGVATVRSRQTGDYIGILPEGSRKTVKAFMIDEKIPVNERDKIPLVADGHHILWIVGYRISQLCKVTNDTRMVLKVEYKGEEQKKKGEQP